MKDVFLSLGLAFFPVTMTITGLWLAARSRADRAEETIRQIALGNRQVLPNHAASPGDVAPTLDAILLEVERIAEGQRFTTKLLSERRDSVPGSSVGRVITPH
jgi:hypothetical protein